MVLILKRKQVGSFTPAYAANTPFKLDLVPPDGILKAIDFYIYGTHAGVITTGATDGEWNIISSMMITISRRGGRDPIVWNVRPRDIKYIGAFLEGQTPANAVNTGDGATFFGLMRVHLALPPRMVINPMDYGIDSADIAGPIAIEGEYGPLTNLGTGVTAITAQCRVSCIVAERRVGSAPQLVLGGNSSFIRHVSDEKLGPDRIGVGYLKALYGLFIRQHDADALAAQRVDGLITRFILDHSRLGQQIDEFAITLKKDTNMFFGMPAAEVPAGLIFPVFANRGSLNDMPVLGGGQSVELTHDSQETVPAEVTNVTPAAGDGLFVTAMGVLRV